MGTPTVLNYQNLDNTEVSMELTTALTVITVGPGTPFTIQFWLASRQ